MLKLKKNTALNLSLEGSIGSFKVSTSIERQNSLEVLYFITHLGLDFSTSGSNSVALSHLAPVREIFNFQELDFDEIMQRDIDDARVSGELIPYLLDSKSADLIKLFPPIIIVVLPVKEQQNRPEDFYSKVDKFEIPEKDDEPSKWITRSGAIGQEIFEFEQPIHNGEKLKHDLVRFKLNTHKTKLVIVDGQHRAMALLALYRNLKDEWSDEKRAPYKEYYAEWTSNYIQQFNLKEINLPVMFCTFPDLDTSYTGDIKLKNAARAIFLTLNKTARPVSNSRNILLDDNDIISYFLRRCFSVIKQKDNLSPYSMRIFNIELDQVGDRLKVTSPIAITGVNHVYYMIEHLLLNKYEDVNGAKPRTGKFFKRIDLDMYGLMDRLNGRNSLGAEIAESMTRHNYTANAVDLLADDFNTKYGKFIISMYEMFSPYEIHNKSVLKLQTELEVHEDRKLLPILFEGQGIARVFNAHRTNLKEKIKENLFETDVPKIEALAKRLDSTAIRIENALNEFRKDRSENYLSNIADKNKLKDDDALFYKNTLAFINDLYSNVFSTVAFQSALICSYFSELEKTNHTLKKSNKNGISYEESFEEYISQLNAFFLPKKSSKFKNLARLFAGEPEENNQWRFAPSKQTFRAVVYRHEMQPDQWPKYKYLFLELWTPSNCDLSNSVKAERDKCRDQIFTSLYDEFKANYARQKIKHEDSLEPAERNLIFEDTCFAFEGFLSILGKLKSDIPDRKQLSKLITEISEDADETIGEQDLWDSVDS